MQEKLKRISRNYPNTQINLEVFILDVPLVDHPSLSDLRKT